MTRQVKEVAQLVGVTIRTLHYYDQIGLLTPSRVTPAGYRLYEDEDLDRLQAIIFFKDLGFSLKEIGDILDDPNFDRKEALQLQRQLLYDQQEHLETMIQRINQTIQALEGEIEMTKEEEVKDLIFNSDPYEAEARKRWGNQAVDESQAKLKQLSQSQQEALGQEWEEHFEGFVGLMDQAPASHSAQEAMAGWFTYLNQNFGTYSKEAFKGLGQLYIHDERFKVNIDQYGPGLAQWLSQAMAIYGQGEES